MLTSTVWLGRFVSTDRDTSTGSRDMARVKTQKSARHTEAEAIITQIKARLAEIKAAEEKLKAEKAYLKGEATKLKAAIDEEKEKARLKREEEKKAKEQKRAAKPKKKTKNEEAEEQRKSREKAERTVKLAKDVADELSKIFGLNLEATATGFRTWATVEKLHIVRRAWNKQYHPDAGKTPDMERCAMGNMFLTDFMKRAEAAGRYERRAA